MDYFHCLDDFGGSFCLVVDDTVVGEAVEDPGELPLEVDCVVVHSEVPLDGESVVNEVVLPLEQDDEDQGVGPLEGGVMVIENEEVSWLGITDNQVNIHGKMLNVNSRSVLIIQSSINCLNYLPAFVLSKDDKNMWGFLRLTFLVYFLSTDDIHVGAAFVLVSGSGFNH